MGMLVQYVIDHAASRRRRGWIGLEATDVGEVDRSVDVHRLSIAV